MIGVNQSNLTQLGVADMDKVCGDIKDFGFTSVRFACDWSYWSNFMGSTNYAGIKNAQAALEEHGLTPLPVLGCHYPYVHTASMFGNFAGKCVDIFGDIPFYEVWNEPNLIAFNIGSPATYLNYLRAAAPKIRAVGAQVIHAGLAAYPTFSSNLAPVDWLTKLYLAGESNDFDAMGYHPYSMKDDQNGTFVDPSTNPFGIAQAIALDSLMNAHGDDRPIFYTEVGFPTNIVNLQNASDWLSQQLVAPAPGDAQAWVACLNPPNNHIWFFCWRDGSGDGGSFGIVDSSNNPKQPYYNTVKNILGMAGN
jgi:hypothetical protein